MKHLFLYTSILFLIFACNDNKSATKIKTTEPYQATSPEILKDSINNTLNNWHQAASNAQFDDYFELMGKEGVFIGTDAGENWQNNEFRNFAKPYFDKGKAWDFKVLDRNVYLSKNGNFAWFDEILDTQMGICRGSGVLENVDGNWKIQHYVLSATIPNELMPEVTNLKKDKDSLIVSSYK